MFSIVNEIKDNSPASMVSMVVSSIGTAACIYLVVGVTGYITFGNAVKGNIVMMCMCKFRIKGTTSTNPFIDPTNAASTIGKAAIVILVLFSIPLQVHPCRASLDAVLKWRPNRSSQNGNRRNGSPVLPAANASRGDHGGSAPMSDTRFALLTTLILTLAYITALSVSSLDRVLAFVGSTGSTSISFILPGLFYYKISDPESIHHQRLIKEDDDIDDEEPDGGEGSSMLGPRRNSATAEDATRPQNVWRWRRKWRWDLEHIDDSVMRKAALALSAYGITVMVVCLIMNIFFAVGH